MMTEVGTGDAGRFDLCTSRLPVASYVPDSRAHIKFELEGL